MTTFVDSSALVKRYVKEDDAQFAVSLIDADEVIVTSWLSLVEVRKAISRLLIGSDLTLARNAITEDFDKIALISLDAITWHTAADIADALGVRSLDAVQLACAQRLRIQGLRFVTFDIRQAVAARALGFNVVGC
jgi:uncharacterized protein